jgi:hypothetical protein
MVYTTAEVERRPKMSMRVRYAALKSQKVTHSEVMTSDILLFRALSSVDLVSSRAISLWMILERRMLEISK